MASYPSSANTWTVSPGTYGPGNTGAIFADCLRTSLALTSTVVKSSAYHITGTIPEVGAFLRYDVACPGGMVTGGGYNDNAGAMAVASRPDGKNGWLYDELNRNGESSTVYVICVRGGLTTSVAHDSTTAGASFSLNVGCSSGQLLVGGGFGQTTASQAQLRFSANRMSHSVQYWNASGANIGHSSYEADAYAVCAKL